MFTKRNVWSMVFFIIITFGIYLIYWLVITKIEMNKSGAYVPTAWLLIIPLGNIYFLYKFAEAFSSVVLKRGDERTIEYFLLFLFLLPIGTLIAQNKINQL
jgi:hypothetical protein